MTDYIKDGGSAFPRTPDYEALRKFGAGPGIDCGSLGMSLRDYLAGQALVGFLVNAAHDANFSDIAKDCYEVADFLIEEGEKQ